VDVLAADPERKPLETVGFAPLTSMYWFGSASERKFDDYRPEVHDSDGLLMRMDSGDTIWRPLVNGPVLRHQIFSANNVRGFGLLQRDRNFSHYQDLFHSYQDVPSVWVAPHGNWGAGDVHLVELSTQYEGLDNVVAFWNPSAKPVPMEPVRFGYTLYWTKETDMTLSSNEVVSTRVGLNPRAQDQRQFVVDFDVPKFTDEKNPPDVSASCSDNATIAEADIFRNPLEKTWRVFLNVLPKPGQHAPVEIKCALKKHNETVSENWDYYWSPP
jgi:glucans biosynthesis protein